MKQGRALNRDGQDARMRFDLDAVNTGSSAPAPTWVVAVLIGVCVVGMPVLICVRSRRRK